MAEQSRIEELRRRLQHDPTSIAFAQLAEALRRQGRVQDAIDTCRAGLTHHPDYVSAHVTLGRALIDADQLDAAQVELDAVLAAAKENLAAIRGLADIHQRRGQQREALEQYRRALTLAPHDPELEQTVSRLTAGLEPASQPPAPPAEPPPGIAAPGAADPEPEPSPPSRQVEALERWLDAILADRERPA